MWDMQPSLRAAWNWMVSRVENALLATEAKAVKDGIIPTPVFKPSYQGLTPDQAKSAKLAYRQACADRRQQIFDLKIPVEWRPNLSGKDSEAERLGFKHDYQVINWHLRCVWACPNFLPQLPKLFWSTINKGRPDGRSLKGLFNKCL